MDNGGKETLRDDYQSRGERCWAAKKVENPLHVDLMVENRAVGTASTVTPVSVGPGEEIGRQVLVRGEQPRDDALSGDGG